MWLAHCVKGMYTRILIRQIIRYSPNVSQLLGFRQEVFEVLSDFMWRLFSTPTELTQDHSGLMFLLICLLFGCLCSDPALQRVVHLWLRLFYWMCLILQSVGLRPYNDYLPLICQGILLNTFKNIYKNWNITYWIFSLHLNRHFLKDYLDVVFVLFTWMKVEISSFSLENTPLL